MTDRAFSLLDEPWVLCRRRDDSIVAVSIRDVFEDDGTLIAVCGESPTQDYAVLRTLLAIFWRAHRRTEADVSGTFRFTAWRREALNEARSGTADGRVLDYVAEFAPRFDLLHPTAPFMQVADLATPSGAVSPVSRIVPDAENDFFTLRDGEGRESISFAEAARWTVHTHAYDPSGIKSGALGDPRVKGGRGYPIGVGWSGMTGGTIVEGRTLRETLVLNTPRAVLLADEADRPVWERPPDTSMARPVEVPAGAADIATWQSRRIRLFHDSENVRAVLVSNGDRIPDAGANVFADPMTPYRWSKNKSVGGKVVYYPLPYPVERTMWKSLEPLILPEGEFALGKGEHAPKRPVVLDALGDDSEDISDDFGDIRVRLVSASYGPQDSTHAASVDAHLDVSPRLFEADFAAVRSDVVAAARAALKAATCLGQFGGDLLLAAGGDYAFQPDPTESLLASLEPDFRDWVRKLRPESDETVEAACVDWQRHVTKEVLDRATVQAAGAGPRALIGRVIATDTSERVVSAATAMRALRKRLTSELPLAPEHSAFASPSPQQTN
ncbi:type I-E CRISPR-associated protein Cse1/CasA [Brevibacterium sp. BRM-1]|uniref:type I-E CRISPR-associated protein Cse1/CasA n=1 Tax=Brevibacterium sp. BRM-1 TaxID=2999062 RepID=UPI00227E39F7|nr:type I-E CRISPR-associated protein Cse1/CasA [Brevibacterium sp. BRM-1]WAL39137.1 type I-E CRISPR-associated protein Cse1/CasA [Brevibacterium sp. BRM-1]